MTSFSNELKLFYHLYEKIISREIITFSSLIDDINKVSVNFNPQNVILKSFKLIKELYWGYFKDLDRSGFPKLWKELVITNEDFDKGGDLKRNISISRIYVALLDIHGYTNFCYASKNNLSSLRKLDDYIHSGIKKIALNNQVIVNRERGDEIVVIAPTATTSIKTALEIMNSFSRRTMFKDKALHVIQKEFSIVMHDFKITAGIAGGNINMPLVITDFGLLTGHVINTAARLQSRANELSPKDTKILVTKSVYSQYVKEKKQSDTDFHKKDLVAFFNHGPIVFKGVSLPIYELIYIKKEKYRAKYENHLVKLIESVRQGLWQRQIFNNLIEVLIEVLNHMPDFSTKLPPDPQEMTNSTIIDLCQRARFLYEEEDDYIAGITQLVRIKQLLETVDTFDKLIFEYLDEILTKYNEMLRLYEIRLDHEIENKIDVIFDSQYRVAYYNARKNYETYEKLKVFARRSKAVNLKKNTWYALMEENKARLDIKIYSGKK